MRFFLGFYHVRRFMLLCLPKGCLLRSNRLSLKKSLEEATEALRRLWKGQLWRERGHFGWTRSTRRAGAEQSSKPFMGVWRQLGDRVFGGLGALWEGSWGPISEQNGGLEDTGGRHAGFGGNLEGPRRSKVSILALILGHF